jgi:pilus assembly protein CpaC
LRDGQSFALAGLLDNQETQQISKVPGLGDIPILGNLFRSKQFQKNETELMFIVTAQTVKPVNRDDLPRIPAVENLKNGSLLGVEPKAGAGVTGPTGFMISPNGNGNGDSVTPKMQPVVPLNNPATKPAPASDGTKTPEPGAPAVSVPRADAKTPTP